MWQSAKDANQRTYYFNQESGETTWEKPESLWTDLDRALNAENWIEYTTEQGRPYWYNTDTQKSVWEVPVTIESSTTNASLVPAKVEDLDQEFNQMLERLQVGEDYLVELPRLVKEPIFWAAKTALDRQNRFDKYLTSQKQTARSIANAERQARIKVLCNELESVAEASESWETAEKILQPLEGSHKEKAFAFVKTRQLRQAQLAAKQDATHQQIAPRLQELLGGVTLSSSSKPEWNAVRSAVENQLPLDPDTDYNRLVNVYDEFAESKYAALMGQLDEHTARSEQKARRARTRFVQVLEELRKNEDISVDTKWQDIVSKIPTKILDRLCGTEGSTPLDLFWDIVADEKRRLRLQTGLVEDTLTAKNIDMNELDETKFVSLFNDDKRLQKSKLLPIFHFLNEDRHKNHRPRPELEY